MTRLHFGGVFAVAAAVIVGCGPAKELPEDVPVHKGTDTGERAAVVPAASEPEAKAYVEKAVKAFTGGKPGLVAKGRVSRLAVKGMMLYPVENQKVPVEAARTIAAVWPDRIAGTNELQIQGVKATIRAWLHRPRLTILNGEQEAQPPNRAEAERNFAADFTGQHWMPLLVPLTDPTAVVFDLHKQALPQQSVQTLKLSLGAFPIYQLTFDANTDALLRVEYAVSEQGATRRRQWSGAEHKPGPEGLVLPQKTECRHDNVTVEEWAVEKWEFPPAIDDGEFAPPAK
jgi:hypothetical protein